MAPGIFRWWWWPITRGPSDSGWTAISGRSSGPGSGPPVRSSKRSSGSASSPPPRAEHPTASVSPPVSFRFLFNSDALLRRGATPEHRRAQPEPKKGQHQQEDHDLPEALHVGEQSFEPRTHQVAHEDEKRDVEQRSGEIPEEEAPAGHLQDAGRQEDRAPQPRD